MDPLEITARREALGMSQAKLAEWLPWKTSRVSEAQSGRRAWPDWATARLEEAEELADQIAETLYEAGLAQGQSPALVPSYADDQAFWDDWPDLDGLPACVHRVAAAEALKMLRDEGVPARIVNVGGMS